MVRTEPLSKGTQGQKMLPSAMVAYRIARPEATRITKEPYEPIRPCREEIPAAIAEEHMEMSEAAPLARHPEDRTAHPDRDRTPGRVQKAARVVHTGPQAAARALQEHPDPVVLEDRPVETDSPK